LPKSVVTNANSILLPTIELCFGPDTSVGVIQWAAETMGILHEKDSLTTQWKDNIVRESIWVTAQTMSISNKQCAGPEKWNIPTNYYVTLSSDLQSKRPLLIQYMADNTSLDDRYLRTALNELVEIWHP